MAKVKDLLCIPVLKDIKILAGKSGLDRPVEHVTVMEVPDIKRWLKGNDFLITSFYSVRKGVEEQCRLIEELGNTISSFVYRYSDQCDGSDIPGREHIFYFGKICKGYFI